MYGESRLLSEWLQATYADRDWHIQFRVGNDPAAAGFDMTDEGERRWARTLNRRVDALVEPPPNLVVIEATMYRPTEKIGRLAEYMLLLPATPDVAPWLSYPRDVVLLTGYDDPIARTLCQQAGYRYVYYEPEWIEEWRAIYPQRRRRAPHSGLVDLLASDDGQ